MFDKFSEADYSNVLSYESARDSITELIIKTCKDNGFDGVVLEFWFQLAGMVQETYLIRLVEHVGNFSNRNSQTKMPILIIIFILFLLLKQKSCK